MVDYAAVFTNFTGAFPDIVANNVSAPGAGDGTEFVKLMVDDIWGRAQAIMNYAGLTPDGVSEADGTAQILEALNKGWGIGPGMGVIYWKDGTPAANGDRVLLLQGQVILISSYPLLAAACYIGDGNNADTDYTGFYKTSDAGGVTRSTSGTYMVLPDARGLSLKNIGDATVNTRTKTGPVKLTELQEDQAQKITGSLTGIAIRNFAEAGAFTDTSKISDDRPSGGSDGNYQVEFDSADSPDARASSTTAGPTRDSVLATNFGITY